MSRWLPRGVAVFYLLVILLGPLGFVFYRTFEHGFSPAWHALSSPDTIHAFKLTLLMVAISLILWPVARMGLVYLGAAVGLGAVFIWQAYALWRRSASEEASTAGAIQLYKYSISYLSLLFLAIAVDALLVVQL